MPTDNRSLPGRDSYIGLSEGALETIFAEQRAHWLAGKRTPSAVWLRQHPALACNPDQTAALVYHEFALRQELRESPAWEDYLRDFPQYAELLGQLREADAIVQALGTTEPVKPPAAHLDDYELLEEVGRGGMGVVCRARQRSLGRIVALKVIRAGDDASEEERRRFRNEARAVACLQHPNIVQIFEVGDADGHPFLVLEFVEGQSLARHLNGTPLPAATAAALVEVLARAVHHAHRQGIIHRDLKPSNVLLAGTSATPVDRCVPKVTDFGLAKRLHSESEPSGATLGTPSYMAPEQTDGGAVVGPPTDVYGLGAVLYELLTGRPPFLATSPLETLKQVVEREPVRPRLLNPTVPRDLETICLKCLQKDARRRYASAEGLAEDLQRFLKGEPIKARPVSLVERGWRWCRRKPALATLTAALLLVVLGGLGVVARLWWQARASEVRAQESERDAVARWREAEDRHARTVRVLGRMLVYARGMPMQDPDRGDDLSMLVEIENHYRDLLQQRPEDALVAFRQAAQHHRRVFERAPDVLEHRQKLSQRYGQVAYWLRLCGHRTEAVDNLLERKKLWTGNAEMLLDLVDDFAKLAEAVGDGRKELTPSEQEERRRYVDLGEQVAREAAAAKPRTGGTAP